MKWNPDDEGPFIVNVMSRTGVTVSWAAGKRRSFMETSWTCHELLMSPCDLVWEIGNPKRPSHSLSLSHPPTFPHGAYHAGRYYNAKDWGKTVETGTSLVVQWLRLCLPMQAVQVQFPARELRSNMSHRQRAKT